MLRPPEKSNVPVPSDTPNICSFLTKFIDYTAAKKQNLYEYAGILKVLNEDITYISQQYCQIPPEGTAAVNRSMLTALELLQFAAQSLLHKMESDGYSPYDFEEEREAVQKASEIFDAIEDILKVVVVDELP